MAKGIKRKDDDTDLNQPLMPENKRTKTINGRVTQLSRTTKEDNDDDKPVQRSILINTSAVENNADVTSPSDTNDAIIQGLFSRKSAPRNGKLANEENLLPHNFLQPTAKKKIQMIAIQSGV